jgi:hypothetical protein
VPKAKDITGQKFGRLTAIESTPDRDSNGRILWLCNCECGKTKITSVSQLMSLNTRSCGCLLRRVDITKPKTCRDCKLLLPAEKFQTFKPKHSPYPYKKSRCRRCAYKYLQSYRKRTGKGRLYHLKSKFNISSITYNQMLISQSNACRICGTTKSNNYKNRNLSVDHCHVTGAVRGLLCNACNSGLGYFKDNCSLLETAIKYLKREI